MLTLFPKAKYLIIFVDESEDNKIEFENNIKRLKDIIQNKFKTSQEPLGYKIEFIKAKRIINSLKKIDSVRAENEFAEQLNPFIDEVKSMKKKSKMPNVIVMLRRSLFNETNGNRIFTDVISESQLSKMYDTLCYVGDFLTLKKRVDCLERTCTSCNEIGSNDPCVHSCQARLLWILFDKTAEAEKALKELSKNDE